MRYKICPICALVVITWVAGLFGIYFAASWANPLIVAMLMGASVGALAEKYGSRLGPALKAVFVILGFIAVYYLVNKSFWPGAGLAVLTLAVLMWKIKKSKPASAGYSDKFKDCC